MRNTGVKRKLVIMNGKDNGDKKSIFLPGKKYKGTVIHCYGGDDDDWLDDTVLVED